MLESRNSRVEHVLSAFSLCHVDGSLITGKVLILQSTGRCSFYFYASDMEKKNPFEGVSKGLMEALH